MMNNLPLPDLKILRLSFCLKPKSEADLPPFLGTTLRGVFGTALKQILCNVPHGNCDWCWFYEACNYQFIFESPNLLRLPREEIHPKLRGQKELLQPFFLVPPRLIKKEGASRIRSKTPNFNDDYERQKFTMDDEMRFSITLFGRAVNFWSYIFLAVKLAGEIGLGEHRIPFILTEVISHNREGKPVTVFDFKDEQINAAEVYPAKLAEIVYYRQIEMQNLLKKQFESIKKNRLQINFLSPTRIRFDGKIEEELPFPIYLKKVTDRLEFLASLYSEPAQWTDYRPILENAPSVTHKDNNLKLYEFEQFSNTIGEKTKRKVIVENISYEATSFEEYLPYLIASEITGVGSNTSFGFGFTSISIPD